MRCHFVPQSYLRRFTNAQNMLECFDLNRKFSPTKTKATKATSQIEDWYVLTGIDALPGLDFVGEKQIEEDYQRLFENDLTPSLDRLEAHALTAGDKATLAHFIAYQLHRVPVSRSYYRAMQQQDPALPLAEEQQKRRIAEIVFGHIGTSISAITLAPYLVKSQWVLVRNDGGVPFITSDNPVGVHRHPSNMNFARGLEQGGISGPELEARKTAYGLSVSPKNVLYVNTSVPTEATDVRVWKGKWDEPRVRAYNDLVFRTCLSCVYTVTRAVAEDHFRRFSAGEVSQDLFTDDPWNEGSKSLRRKAKTMTKPRRSGTGKAKKGG